MKKAVVLQSIFLVVLFIIILLQRCDRTPVEPVVHYDTIVRYDTVRDTVEGKIVYIKSDPDTVWLAENPPDTTYDGLKEQYITLGNKFFAENTFTSRFPIEPFGHVDIRSRVKENQLISSSMISELRIPETIITITTESPPTRQLYGGMVLRANVTTFKVWPELGLLYKDRKDRIFGVSAGYNGDIEATVSNYWKIKLRKR